MSAGRARIGWWVAVVAAGAAAEAARLPSLLAVAALAATFLVTPGALASRLLFARTSRETVAAAALALAPFLAGAPLAALVVAGVPIAVAARAVALAIGAVALLAALRGVAGAPPADRIARVAGWAALLWTAAIAALLIGNRFLPLRSDGWYHVGVVLQVLERGLPPEDPYFAGVRALYFWGVHAWAAGWLALAPQLAATTPLIAFNLSASAAVVLAVAALARRLGAGPRMTALAAALATLGYSPFTWLIPVARSMTGEVRGMAELSRTLGSGADGILGNLALFQLHESMGFFGDKGLVLTQFGMGLAFVPLTVVALAEIEERRDARATAGFAALLAAALFEHTVVGYALVLMTGAIGLAWLPRAARGDRAAQGLLVRAGVAVVVAVGLLAPYLIEITLGKQGRQVQLDVRLPAVVTLLVGGALYVVPGFLWLGRERRTAPAGIALAFAAVLLALGLCAHLPENNESKFDNLLFVLLPAPAALAWGEWLRRGPAPARGLLRAGLVAGVAPTALLGVWGFASEHGQCRMSWHEPTPAVREAMAWARAHTPPDAAFCDLGGAVDLVSLAGRSVLWGGFIGERDFGYAPAALAARRDLAGSLCRGRDPGPAGMALLRSLTRPVIVMRRASMPDSLADDGRIAARPDRYEPLWHNAEVSFWKVRVP